MYNAQLIKKLREGDHHAYKFIFDHYYALMGAIAYEYVEDYYISQNIVEDVMMSIWEKREQLIISTSVKSYLEALDDGALDEEIAPNFIKVSLDETNRMMRMISDLLALSRIDNKSTQLDVEMTNFTAFMTYILNRFDQIKSQETNTGKTYEIIRDYPVNSIWVEIDTDKMTQVVDNILNNAIKYSPDGGKITVSMKTTDSQLIVSISDQGLGIPKKDLPLIFDRFYRVDKARSRAQGGTGLGLSIAKEIIKQHKGFIWAKSEYGKGSTFTIVLPYDKDAMMVDEWEM